MAASGLGMGISAYRHNAKFRAHFDNIDDHFRQLAGWSLKEALFSDRLGERLALTRVAQPLIFAIQSAMTAALKVCGVRPSAVIGHSVGEVAAAEAAGILDLRTAVEVIYFRSAHQEAGPRPRAHGGDPRASPRPSRSSSRASPIWRSRRAIILAPPLWRAPQRHWRSLKRIAEDRGIAFLDLELEYPFHTAFMTPIETPLIADLKHIRPHNEAVPFVSTVTGSCLPGSRLGADYWWLNIREPVQFIQGIREVAKLGARFFVEIGPRGMLLKHIDNSLVGRSRRLCYGLSARSQRSGSGSGSQGGFDSALISGAKLDTTAIFGADPGAAICAAVLSLAAAAISTLQRPPRRSASSRANVIRSAALATRAMHWNGIRTSTPLCFPHWPITRSATHVIFPGTGFVEIALAVARAWLRTNGARIADCEILRPLDLTNGETREIMSRVSANSKHARNLQPSAPLGIRLAAALPLQDPARRYARAAPRAPEHRCAASI